MNEALGKGEVAPSKLRGYGLTGSPESLKALDSLESLEDGQILLCFPRSGDSLESLESLNSQDLVTQKGLNLKLRP